MFLFPFLIGLSIFNLLICIKKKDPPRCIAAWICTIVATLGWAMADINIMMLTAR